MNDYQEKLKELQDRMDLLVQRQKTYIVELKELRQEVRNLQAQELLDSNEKAKSTQKPLQKKTNSTFFNTYTETEKSKNQAVSKEVSDEEIKVKEPEFELNLEKFIGENLISKIGILITIIGVAIGAKYSIDNDLISPLTRIILAYLVGVGLLGFGMKLKEKYLNYSAVLVSGAIAILYFTTFIAYSFYGLFPQLIAFALMVLFTIFTVIAAISYDKPIIAHIGLVGAYAVPFFLSNGSGAYGTFFSYIAIINIGILIISFEKYWKSLYYAAFAQTWLIFSFWWMLDYSHSKYFGLALTFLTIFFAIFYLTFLAYKLIKKEKFNFGTIVLLLLNSFIFYGIGFDLLSSQATKDYLGLFTLGNGVIHFVVGSIIYRQKLFDKQLFYLVIGLVLVFITMAIPVQLDGNWVTLLWIAQAVLLFWIGRTRTIPFYEKIAYALIALSTVSILDDLGNAYYNYNYTNGIGQLDTITPIFNIHFLTITLFIIAIGFINYLHQNSKYPKPSFIENGNLKTIINYGLGTLLLLSIYIGFYLEISNYFNLLYQKSFIQIEGDNPYPIYNYTIRTYETVWIIIYTIVFLIVLSFINILKWKNTKLGYLNLGLNAFMVIVFLTSGIYELGNLHDDYFFQTSDDLYKIGFGAIALKYLAFTSLAALIFTIYQYIKTMFDTETYRMIFETALGVIIIWLISSEFITWTETAGSAISTELGLSIVWGIYALLVISYGIWKKKKHLRIMAMALFGITLAKLFLYDLSHLNTISKTIVLVALGILLLFISFLYNKYKEAIFGEE